MDKKQEKLIELEHKYKMEEIVFKHKCETELENLKFNHYCQNQRIKSAEIKRTIERKFDAGRKHYEN